MIAPRTCFMTPFEVSVLVMMSLISYWRPEIWLFCFSIVAPSSERLCSCLFSMASSFFCKASSRRSIRAWQSRCSWSMSSRFPSSFLPEKVSKVYPFQAAKEAAFSPPLEVVMYLEKFSFFVEMYFSFQKVFTSCSSARVASIASIDVHTLDARSHWFCSRSEPDAAYLAARAGLPCAGPGDEVALMDADIPPAGPGCPACDAESDVEAAPTCNLTGWIPARGAICGICSGPAGILDVIFVQKLVARITKAKTRC
mmetsp:Transcript_19007/g.47572  ORF Transcript_19007/g.47572 Transcript_19007/m.47572 type:complete len:255 (-) Transcript_19007:161-925(-)